MKYGNAKLLDGMLNKDDITEVADAIAQKEIAQRVKEKLADLQSKAKGPRLLRLAFRDDYTESDARELMPSCTGARLVKDIKNRQCWQAFMPTEVAPFSRCRTWNHERTSLEALHDCLTWAWEQSDRDCPYDLSSMLQQ